MTTQVNEFDGEYGSQDMAPPPSIEMPLAGMALAKGDGDNDADDSIVVGDPVGNMMDPSSVTIYANTISPVSYSSDSAIVAFDVVFSVGCVCPDGKTSTYQVVKRIGVDKMKMANDAKMTTPVSIVEAKQPEKVIMAGVTTARFKALAGLN